MKNPCPVCSHWIPRLSVVCAVCYARVPRALRRQLCAAGRKAAGTGNGTTRQQYEAAQRDVVAAAKEQAKGEYL